MTSIYLKKKNIKSIKVEIGVHFSTDTRASVQERYYYYFGLNQSLKPPETRDSQYIY